MIRGFSNANVQTFCPRSCLEIPIYRKIVVKSNIPKKDIISLTTIGCFNINQSCGAYSAVSLNSVHGYLVFY